MFKIIYRVLSLLKDRKLTAVFLSIANFLFAILILIEPIFFKNIIDIFVEYTPQSKDQINNVFPILFMWLFVWLTVIILRLYVSIAADRLWHQEFNKIIIKSFSHILELSMKYHTNSNSWELVKKLVRWIDCIFYSQLDIFRRLMPDIFTIVILIPLVLILNWKLWLFVIILWTIAVTIWIFSSNKTFSKQDQVEKYYTEASSLYSDTFSNIQTVKSFSLLNMKKDKLSDILNNRITAQYPILNWWWFLVSFSNIVKIIITLWIIFFWSYLFFRWEVSLGEIVMFISFSTILLWIIENLTRSIQDIFWRIAPIKDYFKICDTDKDIKDSKWAINLRRVVWNINFSNVTFSYDGKRDVINNVSLDVKKWEKVAFVWHTWSWKTTMTNLLLRFYEVNKWEILIDWININSVTQESLRKNIWVVFQDSSMFNTTLADNIRLDNKEATFSSIQEVAKKSHSFDFIMKLSNWFDTIVWERWVKLSGWEKQRLAIARTLLKDAPILILDEATSALDTETEKYLQESFEELMKWRTTFIIAHRLSTIRKADRIFVFDNWKIIESWTYKELNSLWWAFTRLVKAQTDWFIE